MEHTNDIVWYPSAITREQRERLNRHQSVIVWFTGLSGAGKSTLAHAVEEALHRRGCRTFVLDGDNVRHGLCADLAFSDADRTENIRRVGELARLFLEAGVITLTAFISPFRKDRERVRSLVPPESFIEIHCHCPLFICEQRDVKGLYRRARTGKIPAFTGISPPYEAPDCPELVVETGACTVDEGVAKILSLLEARGVIP